MTNASTTSTATTTGTTGQFTSANWVETVIAPAEPTTVPRLARAAVTNDFAGGITAAGSCEYTLVYATEKTGGFNGLELLTGTLDGRPGSFVLDHRGSFTEDGTIHCEFEVVPGSGTGRWHSCAAVAASARVLVSRSSRTSSATTSGRRPSR